MKITVLCSDPLHPVMKPLKIWAEHLSDSHHIDIVHRATDISQGDLLFLVSCHEIVGAAVRHRYVNTLVIHASDLPIGRGWSPHIWAILGGSDRIVVSLIEAQDPVDSGAIWKKTEFHLAGHELYDEVNELLVRAHMELMNFAIENFGKHTPAVQSEDIATYWPRRRPDDSRLDLDKTIREQLPLLRIADPVRYPAFFEYSGFIYEVRISKRLHDIGASPPAGDPARCEEQH